MRTGFLLGVAMSSVALPALQAQSAPTVSPTIAPAGNVNGGSLRPTSGELSYSLAASESYVSGYQGTSGAGSSTNLSGQAEYVSNSETHPFSLVYSGGYFFGNGSDITSSSYQNLGISQLLKARRWRLGIADTVTFLPSSALFGVSGVPGSGDVGSTPITTGTVPTQSVLTNYGQQVTNTVSGSAARDITGKTYVDGFASYTIQRFLQTGLNNNSLTAAASAGHRFSPLNTLSAGYSYSRFTFATAVNGINNIAFIANGVSATYSHIFTRRLSMQVTAGPQWITSNATSVIPNSVLFSTAIGASYTAQRTKLSVGYSRSPNIGSGVLIGALSNNVNVSLQHTFTPKWSGGLTGNYGRASGLTTNSTVAGANSLTNSFYGGVQVNRRIGENFSLFGSYSAATQTTSGLLLTQNAFNGTANIVSAGITFTPRSFHVGRP